MTCNVVPPPECPESGPRPGQGLAIKAYRVAPRTHSVCSHNTQEKLPLAAMKFFIVLFAIVAAVSAGYIGHGAQHIHVGGGPVIPAQKAAPLALHGNDHTTRIHWGGSHIGHPHLVGVEHFNPAPHYEPSVTNVAVHGHGWH